MDRETINHYAWAIISCIVVAILLIYATPFGDSLAVSIATMAKGQDAHLKDAYSVEGNEEIHNSMSELFDATNLLDSGLYSNAKKAEKVMSWEELKSNYYVYVDSSKRMSQAIETFSMSGELIIDNEVQIIAGYTFDDTNNLKVVRTGNGVIQLDSNAFYNAKGLTKFYGGSNLNYIDDYAFERCSNLETIYLEKSMDTIGVGVFDGCENLKEIRYNGTKAEWNGVEVLSALPSGCVVICTDGVF